MSSFTQPIWPSWAYSNIADPFANYNQLSNYPSYLADSMETYQTHHNRLVQHQQMSRTTETKPRLSKEEVEVLEAEFQKNHKPSSNTKKALAESMRVENARINNWFQNRRAREKKEKNIRQYEAKQRLEKERIEAEGGSRYENNRQRDLVASSAPFPEPGARYRLDADEPQSPSEQSEPDQSNDSTEPSQSDDPELLSPLQLPSHHGELNKPGDNTKVAVTDESGSDNELDTYTMTDRIDDYFTMPENLKTDMFSTIGHDFVKSDATQRAVDWLNHDFNAGSLPDSSPSAVNDMKSPDSVDIASRRNRRPAPLSISAGRSQSYTRASDLASQNDVCSSMRRVSSATGSGRVMKSGATPRSPFFDKQFDRVVSRKSSPTNQGRGGSTAPPTPNTPVALQHAAAEAGLTSGFSVGAKYTPPELVLADPTLRTPPTTPGFADGLFNLGAAYDVGMSDLHGSVPMSTGSTNFATYLGQGNQCTTQSVPSLFLQMGQPLYNYVDSNNGYDWSDISPSTASTSSNPQQRYVSMSAAANFGRTDN